MDLGQATAGTEWESGWKSRIQLRAIYTCVEQLPSHNTVCVQAANISRLIPEKILNIRLAQVLTN